MPEAPEGVAQDIEAPAAEQAAVGPLTGDPAIVGVPTFVVGSVMLGLALINYAPAAGGALPIIILATGIGQLLATVWAAALGQSAVAAVFAVFGGFWLSYAALLIGLAHGWWGVTPAATVHTVAAFLISWIVIIAVLTAASLRLPSAFTADLRAGGTGADPGPGGHGKRLVRAWTRRPESSSSRSPRWAPTFSPGRSASPPADGPSRWAVRS